jgi:MerR family mercuric resistance operon transcriptional regulator
MRTITSSRAENLSIGELSKRSGVNIETIRYYERIKMLPAPPLHGERATSVRTSRNTDIGFHPAIPRPRVHS